MAPGNAPRWTTALDYLQSAGCLPVRPAFETALILLTGSFSHFWTRPREVPCVLLDGNNGRQTLGARKCTQRDMEFRMGKSVAGDAILPGTLQTSVAHGSPTRPQPTERSRSESEIYCPGVPTVRDTALFLDSETG